MVSTYPSEKWWSSSVGMMKFPIYGNIKHVPNHQPDCVSDNLRTIRRFNTGGYWCYIRPHTKPVATGLGSAEAARVTWFFPTYSALGGWEIPNSWVDIDRYPPEHSHKYHKFGPSRHAGPKFIAFPQTSSTFPRPQLNRLENSTQVTRLRILSQLQRSESQRLNYPPIIKHGNGNQW